MVLVVNGKVLFKPKKLKSQEATRIQESNQNFGFSRARLRVLHRGWPTVGLGHEVAQGVVGLHLKFPTNKYSIEESLYVEVYLEFGGGLGGAHD